MKKLFNKENINEQVFIENEIKANCFVAKYLLIVMPVVFSCWHYSCRFANGAAQFDDTTMLAIRFLSPLEKTEDSEDVIEEQ